MSKLTQEERVNVAAGCMLAAIWLGKWTIIGVLVVLGIRALWKLGS